MRENRGKVSASAYAHGGISVIDRKQRLISRHGKRGVTLWRKRFWRHDEASWRGNLSAGRSWYQGENQKRGAKEGSVS